LIRLVEEVGDLILMVKPQFEVGKELVGKGGVVREAALWASAIEGVALTAWQQGWGVKALTRSQLPGMSGNIEFFLWLRRDADQLRESELQRVISQGSIGRENSEGGELL
jgi:23S rRNA (cytidine1920-2'-O)/16S rRNA (cytidine1409-2'-O)-methyltransferase